jgi:hypothetical protein
MELAFAQKAKSSHALPVALRQLLLLVATAFGIAYLTTAYISFAGRPVHTEPASSAFSRGLEAHAQAICGPTAVSAVAGRTMPLANNWGLVFTTRAAVCK